MATKWTFMVYMAGNNSLSDDAGVDLKEMRRQGSTNDVNVLAFVKQEGSNARRFKVAKGGRRGKHKVDRLEDPEDVLGKNIEGRRQLFVGVRKSILVIDPACIGK